VLLQGKVAPDTFVQALVSEGAAMKAGDKE